MQEKKKRRTALSSSYEFQRGVEYDKENIFNVINIVRSINNITFGKLVQNYEVVLENRKTQCDYKFRRAEKSTYL